MKAAAACLAVLAGLATASAARAHHEALFGPQSSLAVESEGFASVQVHTGPFSACDACLRRENNLISTSYRFDFHSLQDAWGKDGNFALLSFALEPPTGDKDYPAFQGPFNFITAGMAGLEWSSFSAVALGYYRRNTPDSTDSKKGDNFLLGLGFAYTPFDGKGNMVSFQLGIGDEYHLPDVDHGVNVGGGNEVVVSPTIVASPLAHVRVFGLVSLPVAQSYSADYQVDRWRIGVGMIYSFDRSPPPPALAPSARLVPEG